MAFVWRRKGEADNPKNTPPQSSMAGPSCFGAKGTGNLVKVDGTMKKEDYCKTVEENVKQPAENIDLVQQWTFQEDNDPKHTSKMAKKRFKDNDVKCWTAPVRAQTSIPWKSCGES